jgi:2-oxoglutarate ferredoxin oxidoreductase subunit delta
MGRANQAREATPESEAPAEVALPVSDGSPARSEAAATRARAKRSFTISLYLAWCKRCGICGAFCPTEALVNDPLGTPLVADEAKCNGCLQCMHRCPDFCVEVDEKSATVMLVDAPPRPGGRRLGGST